MGRLHANIVLCIIRHASMYSTFGVGLGPQCDCVAVAEVM